MSVGIRSSHRTFYPIGRRPTNRRVRGEPPHISLPPPPPPIHTSPPPPPPFPRRTPFPPPPGSPRRCCDRPTRPETPRAGALTALGGLSLPHMLAAETSGSARPGKARSV